MANVNEQATHTKHAETPTFREDEYITLDLKLDELAYASGQGARTIKNVKQELFCHEYLVDFNITQAAIRAGYSPNGAGQTGHKLLKQNQIGDRIRYLYRKRIQRLNAKGDDVVRELQAIAFSDIADYININKKGEMSIKPLEQMENTKALKEVSVSGGRAKTKRIVLHDKVAALEKLMRHLGLDNPVELIIRMKKLEIDLLRTGISQTDKVDDGFMDAMGEASEDVMLEFEATLQPSEHKEENANAIEAPAKPEFNVRHNIVGGNL